MSDFVSWFRDSSPYINVHQGHTFVLYLDGQIMMDGKYTAIINDIALLSNLGIHLVVVTAAEPEIEARLTDLAVECRHHNGHLIADAEVLAVIRSVVGEQRVRLEGLLSMGLPNTPMHNTNIQVVSGNYVVGRPLGIIEGEDYCYTGTVRSIRHEMIRQHMRSGSLVHLGCLGYSITGEVFNLAAEEIAGSVATALGADKLIVLTADPVLVRDGEVISELSPDEFASHTMQEPALAGAPARRVQAILKAARFGVPRCHLLDYRIDGVLLQELFSHQGCGSQIALRRSDQVRVATLQDIGGILELIAPLEYDKVLVRRSRQQLEQEINQFVVTELDGLITGCAALYSTDTGTLTGTMGELACLAIHSSQHRRGIGEALLSAIERTARKQKIDQLFVLTTQTEHWFVEQGFEVGQLSDLPRERQKFYNFQRGSKVLIKPLKAKGESSDTK